MASSSRSSEGAGDPIEVEAVTVEEGSRDRRTSEQRGKLGVAPAAGIQAHKKISRVSWGRLQKAISQGSRAPIDRVCSQPHPRPRRRQRRSECGENSLITVVLPYGKGYGNKAGFGKKGICTIKLIFWPPHARTHSVARTQTAQCG